MGKAYSITISDIKIVAQPSLYVCQFQIDTYEKLIRGSVIFEMVNDDNRTRVLNTRFDHWVAYPKLNKPYEIKITKEFDFLQEFSDKNENAAFVRMRSLIYCNLVFEFLIKPEFKTAYDFDLKMLSEKYCDFLNLTTQEKGVKQ